MNIKTTQGFIFKQPVKTDSSYMVIKGDETKIVLNSIEQINDKFYIVASAEETANWKPAIYKFQILNNDGIEDSGEIEIIINYALADEYSNVKSKNEILLEAIEAQIAGKATTAQSSMSVGDKSIAYCSINELFMLRDYFKKKVAEENGIQNVDGNEMKIKYKWSYR